MVYDKMKEYIETIFIVFKTVNTKANYKKDKKMKMIALMIFNYVLKLAKDNNIDLNQFTEEENINLIPFFEYISYNNIELYDFNKIKIEDVDTSKNEDLERFVLTHIYYITQNK
jgi:DNA phosphorothioation-dependent restriction protein DptG